MSERRKGWGKRTSIWAGNKARVSSSKMPKFASPSMRLNRIGTVSIACLSTILIQCERAPIGMDEVYDRTPVVGCYKSPIFEQDLIAIDPDKIRLNDETIYSRYNYGLDGRSRNPSIYAFPRGYLWSDGTRLKFGINDHGDGATLIPERIGGSVVFSLPVFPTSDTSDFGANMALVSFTKTLCPSDALTTDLE